MTRTPTRRQFLQSTGSMAALALTTHSLRSDEPVRRPRVAAIFTAMAYRLHAHVILENFLEPYLFNGKRTDPGVDVVSIYSDQSPFGDMVPDVARDYGIKVFDSIDGALCLGGKELAVDAVLSIGEHGNYPANKFGQIQYPQKRFFDAIAAVIKRSGRAVPVYNDKHLSHRWDWAKEMVDTARKLGIPLMAGSSVPLAQRIPNVEIPAGATITEAVSIHGGPVERYDFHGLEVLQSMVEVRKGGETGISSVEYLKGEALWKAAEEGRWSRSLAEAAMSAEFDQKPPPLESIPGEMADEPHGILLTYKDGLRACVLSVGKLASRWNFACRIAGQEEPIATRFYVGPWNNRNLFKALSHAIQEHFRNREAPYPVERTLLTSGTLDALMQSRAKSGEVIRTPHLEFAYEPRDFKSMREMGDTWKIVTEETPQPQGIDLTGRQYKRR